MKVTKNMIKEELEAKAYGLNGATLDDIADKAYFILNKCENIDGTEYDTLINTISTIYMLGVIDGMNKQ